MTAGHRHRERRLGTAHGGRLPRAPRRAGPPRAPAAAARGPPGRAHRSSRATNGSSPSWPSASTPRSGRTRTDPASSTSSAPTGSGAATTPTPTTSSPPSIPARTYRVRGRIGDAVYLSLTVYGGPDDGRYSERIVGTVNNRDLDHRRRRHLRVRPQSPIPIDGAGIKLWSPTPSAPSPATIWSTRWRAAGSSGASTPSIPRPAAGRPTPIWPAASGPPSPGSGPGRHRPHPPGRAQHGGRALSRLEPDLRLGGRRRRLRHGLLPAGRRRGPRPRGPLARLRLLERLPLEPVPPHLRLRLRARHPERRPGRLRSRTAPGASSSPRGTPATRTGSPPPATTGAASGSAGSSPTPPRSGPRPG